MGADRDARQPGVERMPGNFVWAQGRAHGAATFARLEGCWYGNDRKIYIVSTSGGDVGQGQIWDYDPKARDDRAAVPVAGRGGAERAGQHHRQPARRPRALRRRRRRGVPARPDRRRRDLPVRQEQRRRSTASATASSATSAAPSWPAPATARTATGCSPTSRARASRSRSPDPGRRARCNLQLFGSFGSFAVRTTRTLRFILGSATIPHMPLPGVHALRSVPATRRCDQC